MSNLIGKSLHITWEELACKDGTPYPSKYVADGRVIELIVMFERIRKHFGDYSIIINSAYRTIAYNKKVGGTLASQHLFGKALDLQPPKDISVRTFYLELFQNANWMGIRGLGRYKTFCHVDIRDTTELITWDLSNK